MFPYIIRTLYYVDKYSTGANKDNFEATRILFRKAGITWKKFEPKQNVFADLLKIGLIKQ